VATWPGLRGLPAAAGRGWELPAGVASWTGLPAAAASTGAGTLEGAGFRAGLATFLAAFLGAGFPAFFLEAAFLRDGIVFLQLVPAQAWVAAKL
ncbi:MAG TPA: hypothetical protein VN728_00620, partial [Stellaceae bacterium]|nr:hypothetical protein [Stellaceae bacterium]